MSPDARGLCCAYVLAVFVALSLTVESQGRNAVTAHYSVVTREGAEADLGFARRWLDAAETLMATKYHVVPDRYHISVNLLYRPENDIDATQSGQNRCCSTDDQGRKTGTILLLGPICSDLERATPRVQPWPSEGRRGLPRQGSHV